MISKEWIDKDWPSDWEPSNTRNKKLSRLQAIEQAARDLIPHVLVDDHNFDGLCPEATSPDQLDPDCRYCQAIMALTEALKAL